MNTPLPKRKYACREERWDCRLRVLKRRVRRDFWSRVDWIERAWVNEFWEMTERRGRAVVLAEGMGDGDWRVEWRVVKVVMKGSGVEVSGVWDICCIVVESICSASSFVSNNPNSVTSASDSCGTFCVTRCLSGFRSNSSIARVISFAYVSNRS